VIETIPKIRLYGFWGENGRFTELLKILEKRSRNILELFRGFPNCRRIFIASQFLIVLSEIPKF